MELVDFSLDPEANAVQICRLSEKPGKVWVCRQQIHNELLQSLCIHRSTLSRLLDKADAIQREATFEEKMFLWPEAFTEVVEVPAVESAVVQPVAAA